MIKKLVLVLAITLMAALPAAALAHESGPGVPAGPPHGMFYAGDEVYESVITPAHVPDRGPFDTLYMFPNCGDCAPVSDAAQGVGNYNGGRWAVVLAFGITEQLTNSDDVKSMASSFEDTGHRFVCPLIKKVESE